MPLVPPLAVLLAVCRVRGRTFPAWAGAIAGALLVVATGGVPPAGALAAIDWGVLATLAALFVVGTGLGRSRLAEEVLARLERLPLSTPVLGALLGGIAVLAALVTNDAAFPPSRFSFCSWPVSRPEPCRVRSGTRRTC